MKTFKTFILTVLVAIFVSALGCEDNADNSNFVHEQTMVIANRNEVGYQNGDAGFTLVCTEGTYEVIPTVDTVVRAQRSSCSGWDEGAVNNLGVGQTIIIYFTSQQINWAETPHPVRPSRIDIYHPQCLLGTQPRPIGSPCVNFCN